MGNVEWKIWNVGWWVMSQKMGRREESFTLEIGSQMLGKWKFRGNGVEGEVLVGALTLDPKCLEVKWLKPPYSIHKCEVTLFS